MAASFDAIRIVSMIVLPLDRGLQACGIRIQEQSISVAYFYENVSIYRVGHGMAVKRQVYNVYQLHKYSTCISAEYCSSVLPHHFQSTHSCTQYN